MTNQLHTEESFQIHQVLSLLQDDLMWHCGWCH